MDNKLYNLLPDFLQYKKTKGYRQKTIDEFDRNLLNFFKFLILKKGEDTDIDNINLNDIDKYIKHLHTLPCPKTSIYGGQNSKLSLSTIAGKVNSIRQFFAYYNRYYNLGINYELIEVPKYKKPEMTFLNEEEFKKLYSCTDQELREDVKARNKVLLYMAWSTGMRVSEILNLRINQIPENGGEIIIKGKGDVVRTVYINKKCKDLIDKYLEYRYGGRLISWSNRAYRLNYNTDFLLVSMGDGAFGKKMTKQMVCLIFQKYRKEMKTTKRITCHTLRHSFATQMLRNKIELRTIQKMLGHQYITTTQGYTHIMNNELHEAHQKVFGI